MRLLALMFVFLAASFTAPIAYAQAQKSSPIVTPPGTMKTCVTDSDCQIVGTGCDECCEFDSINARQMQAYMASKTQGCRGYQGGVCDCALCADKEQPTARCVQSICQSRCEPKP